jgi:hypothetical protein
MKYYYYYIVMGTPVGTAAHFYRGDKHPLDPEAMIETQAGMARAVSLRSKVMVSGDEIAFLNLYELSTEVAKARWPEDFGE